MLRIWLRCRRWVTTKSDLDMKHSSSTSRIKNSWRSMSSLDWIELVTILLKPLVQLNFLSCSRPIMQISWLDCFFWYFVFVLFYALRCEKEYFICQIFSPMTFMNYFLDLQLIFLLVYDLSFLGQWQTDFKNLIFVTALKEYLSQIFVTFFYLFFK